MGESQVLLVGFGNMGRALARGLQRSSDFHLTVCDRFARPDPEVLRGEGLSAENLHWIEGVQQLAAWQPQGRLAVVLATKPQNMKEVTKALSPWLANRSGDCVLISILAGVSIARLAEHLPQQTPIVRAMPNIAATVDEAATVICGGEHTSQKDLQTAKEIFDVVGQTWIMEEAHLDTVTGLSGSGPAYIYMVIEALSDGGVKMGLPRKIALELATQTVIGAGKLVQETGLHPAILRDQVTTPGGTTISAIHELEKHGLRPMLIQAVVTATEKSAEMMLPD